MSPQPTTSTPILPQPAMTPNPPQHRQYPLLSWDKEVSYQIYRIYNTPRLPHIILEYSGHGIPWLIIPSLIFLLTPTLTPISSQLLLNFLLLTIIDLLTIGILKPLFRRKRPTYNNGIGHATIHIVDQYAFPSGHATRAGLIATFIIFANEYYREGLHPLFKNTWFIKGVLAWAICICLSRVALGRHHVLDVLCGAIIGILYISLWNNFWIGEDLATEIRDLLRGLLPKYIRLAALSDVLQS